MGGENAVGVFLAVLQEGSSPRGRGKPANNLETVAGIRLIPAWAGKTPWQAGGWECDRAHPRVGGENDALPGCTSGWEGSSPRGRGKRAVCSVGAMRRRLIPAWAGKTRTRRRIRRRMTAHPRVGGENVVLRQLSGVQAGSSPRGRGKLSGTQAHGVGLRLIPAWAGKTCGKSGLNTVFPAHPRVGGENDPGVFQVFEEGGSSPRGRGKPASANGRSRPPGLIPAWAGKTRASRAWMTTGGAHPRVGGENAVMNHPAAAALGSSPRGRGKPPPGQCRPHGRGLIPAWAWKTLDGRAPRRPARAHPRVGGENSMHRRAGLA